MNNNIQEDYCSFEVSKLLKEKGFACGNIKNAKNPYSNKIAGKFEYPTHSLAINWIRENFGVHIYSYPDGIFNEGWYFGTYKRPEGGIYYYALYHSEATYKSPEEATEAALLYTLKSLI